MKLYSYFAVNMIIITYSKWGSDWKSCYKV